MAAEDWAGARVLVTGGEGFIGSHLAEQLVREGAQVRVLALYNPFGRHGWIDPEVHADIELLPGDMRDPGRVSDAVAGCEAEARLEASVALRSVSDQLGASDRTSRARHESSE